MKTDAQACERAGADPHRISPREAENRKPVDAAEAAHAADNIMQWRAYLPPDCIEAMVAMGWDRST
jgi:hypothetical protein